MESGMKRKNWKEWKAWCLEKKHRKKKVAALVGIFLLAAVLINLLCPGGKLWYALSVKEEISTCRLKKGQYCIESKDPGMSLRTSPEAAAGAYGCFASPYSTEEDLFHGGVRFILYGEVKEIREYVLQGDRIRDGKKVNPVPYYCHVITVAVKRGIDGGIFRGRKVRLLCKWKYHGDRDLADEERIREGKNVLFLVEGDVVKIRDEEKGENLYALGQVAGRLGCYVVENKNYQNLGSLGSRKDTISYFKKHGLLDVE